MKDFNMKIKVVNQTFITTHKVICEMATKFECIEVHESAKSFFSVGKVYELCEPMDCALGFVKADNNESIVIYHRREKNKGHLFNAYFPGYMDEHHGHVAAIFKCV